VLLLCIAPPGVRAAEPRQPAELIGSPAPDWQLETLSGQAHRLAQFRGRAVVLNFWATWCAPCRMETKWLAELYAKYKPDGLEVLGVSMDEASDRAEVVRFAKFYGVNYSIFLHGQTVATDYGGIQYLPQTFFLDRTGKIVNVTRGIQDKETLEEDIQRILR
jgi:peroxiredoxin